MAKVQSLRPVKREVASVTKWLQKNQHDLSNLVIVYETRDSNVNAIHSAMPNDSLLFLAGYLSHEASTSVFGEEE